MAYLPSMAKDASLLDVFRMFPETNEPLIAFHEALLRGPSPFTEGEREFVAAYVSGLNGCRYCRGVHTAAAERLGIKSGVITLLLDDGDTDAISERMRPVLFFAKKLTQHADGVEQSDVDAIFAVGWNETAVYHLVAVVALFNYMNRLVEGLGIELNPAYAQTAAKRLADNGYRPLIEMMRSSMGMATKNE